MDHVGGTFFPIFFFPLIGQIAHRTLYQFSSQKLNFQCFKRYMRERIQKPQYSLVKFTQFYYFQFNTPTSEIQRIFILSSPETEPLVLHHSGRLVVNSHVELVSDYFINRHLTNLPVFWSLHDQFQRDLVPLTFQPLGTLQHNLGNFLAFTTAKYGICFL